MTWPVRVKAVAEAEFAEGAVWYRRRSAGTADRLVAAVEASLARIGESPSSKARPSALCCPFITPSAAHAAGCGEVLANHVVAADGRPEFRHAAKSRPRPVLRSMARPLRLMRRPPLNRGR